MDFEIYQMKSKHCFAFRRGTYLRQRACARLKSFRISPMFRFLKKRNKLKHFDNIINELKNNEWVVTEDIRSILAYDPITTKDKEVICRNSGLRYDILEKIGDVQGNNKFRSINRFILEQEILNSNGGCWSLPGAMLYSVENLHEIGHPEDTILFYEAKEISFDTQMGILSSYFLGAGKVETIKYLNSMGTEEALEVADFIDGI